MKLSQFKFHLPDNLIAQEPSAERDGAKMMVLNRKTGEIEHCIFKDIINFFAEGDMMVLNDTKVFPAMLYGNKEKTNAIIEVFLLRELSHELNMWDVLVEPARKIRIGNKLYFGPDQSLVAEVIDNTTSRGRTIRFLFDGDPEDLKKTLFSFGHTPLPQYIKREPTEADAERYQTIFATKEGAVVAPASCLHFTPILMKKMEIKGINHGFVTVHSGLGNFREIDVEDLTKHRMDSEEVVVSQQLVDEVNATKDRSSRVCAVGTSTMKAFVAAQSMGGHLKPFTGWTNKFVFPPYDFTVADAMVSNFHQSQSSMLMLVAAFGGFDNVMKAYETAIKKKYRFGVYGDALLII